MSYASIIDHEKQTAISNNRFNLKTVRQLVISISKATGVPESDSSIFADALIDADVQGTITHGISRLNIYIRRIQKGLINPTANLEVEKQFGSVLTLNANNGLGQVQASKAIDKLIPLARNNGISSCTIRNSQHFGALSYYCNQVAEKNMILFATTNCEPSMAPEGSSEAFFGTNPIGCSFPTGKNYPVKIDLSTSLVARGKIISAQKKGESIPLDWALSENGEPTSDPSEALRGTMLPMAGHKGSALALMVEIFSGVLTGAAIGPEIGSMYNDQDRKQNVGHFFCLMDISAFMDVNIFKERIDHTIDQIKSSKKRPDVDQIFVPGERSYKQAKESLENGIIIEESTQSEIKHLCTELNIDYTLH